VDKHTVVCRRDKWQV